MRLHCIVSRTGDTLIMRKMICITAGGLSGKNEKFLNEFDTKDTQIELFTGGVCEGTGITAGRVLALQDFVSETTSEPACFCTDIRQLYELVQILYKGWFQEILLLPEQYAESGIQYESYLRLIKETDLSFFVSLIQTVRTLKAYFASAKDFDIGSVKTYTNEKIINVVSELKAEQRELFWKWFEEYIEIIDEKDRLFRLFGLSILLGEKKERKYIEELYQEVHADCYGVDQWFWLFQQIKRFCLEHASVSGMDIAQRLYDEVLTVWKEACRELCTPIPKEERERDRIAVIVLQFIGSRHAPTKTAIERIETLQNEMGRKLVVVHSAEQMTMKGRLPFWNDSIGNIDHRLDGMNCIQGNERLKFQMYQPKAAMPDYQEIRAIIQMLREYKPYEVFVLGNYCLLGDLIASMIPTICISMTFSVLPLKRQQFVAVGKKLTERDFQYLTDNGYDRERYIESVFTFRPIAQTTTLTREALGLPQNRFLLSVVGIRLDSEVTEEFVSKIKPVFEHDCHFVFAGDFFKYEEMCTRIPELKEHSTYVGYQNDILAFQEICDLYVNPPRVGGGFSVVEAFCKGKPAVTLPWGDVAASAGPEFWVRDLKDMADTIIRYKEDTEFYGTQSQKAVARSRELFDGKGALENILAKVENSEKFF